MKWGLPLESRRYLHRRIPKGYIPEYDDSGALTYLRVDYTWSSDEYIEDQWSWENLTPGILQGMAAALVHYNGGGEGGGDSQPDVEEIRRRMGK